MTTAQQDGSLTLIVELGNDVVVERKGERQAAIHQAAGVRLVSWLTCRKNIKRHECRPSTCGWSNSMVHVNY
jgi:hypothetical protein